MPASPAASARAGRTSLPPGAPADISPATNSDSLINYEARPEGADAGRPRSASRSRRSTSTGTTSSCWSPTAAASTSTRNGGGAKSDGVEFTVHAAPCRGFDLSLNGAYTNARLTTTPMIGGLDGDKLPFTPKFTVSLNGDYSFAGRRRCRGARRRLGPVPVRAVGELRRGLSRGQRTTARGRRLRAWSTSAPGSTSASSASSSTSRISSTARAAPRPPGPRVRRLPALSRRGDRHGRDPAAHGRPVAERQSFDRSRQHAREAR